MSEPVKAPALLDKITTLKDGSVKLVFETQELSAQMAANLLEQRNQQGWLIFAPSNSTVTVPDEPPPEFKADKTPSQRLRAVLFVLWKQEGSKADFDAFYRGKMERMIDWVKDKLEGDAA